MEYPKYVSNKEVSAAKVESVEHGADGSLHVFLQDGYDNVILSKHEHRSKPLPSHGWYLVCYGDGYRSFSPAAAFEAGYTLVQADGQHDEHQG